MKDSSSALRAGLREMRGRVARTLRQARKRAGEAEVHRLRVLTRRLRAVLRILKPMPDAAPAQRAARRLRQLGRVLGRRRMWDVLIADMQGLYPGGGRFEARRDAATRALVPVLARFDAGKLDAELKAAGKLLRRMPPDTVARRARKLRAPLQASLAQPPARMPARHALRIELKKARYLLESCGVAAAGARGLQDLLGREHDLHVLQELAGASARARRLEAQARARADRALRAALTETIGLLRALEREHDGARRASARPPARRP